MRSIFKYRQSQNVLSPNGVPKPTFGRKVANLIGIILSILLAVAGIISALTITLQINSSQKLSWAAKFTKSIAQDLIISPLITLGINFIAFTCSRRVQRVRKAAKFLTGEPILELSSGFNLRGNNNIVTHHICIKITKFDLLNQTLGTIGIPPPLEGRSASTLPSQTMITQNKRTNSRPQINSRNTTTTHLTVINNFSDSNFASAINESHDQLNPKLSTRRISKRDSKSQKISLRKHIELERAGANSLPDAGNTTIHRRRRQTERHLGQHY